MIYPTCKPKLLDAFKLLLVSLADVSVVQPSLTVLSKSILLSYTKQVISALVLHYIFRDNSINISPGCPRKFMPVSLFRRSCSEDHVVILKILFSCSLDCTFVYLWVLNDVFQVLMPHAYFLYLSSTY